MTALALTGLGAIGSAAGGILGASSANRAARTQRQAQKFNTAYGTHLLNSAAYGMGGSAFLSKLAEAIDHAVNTGDQGPMNQLVNSPEYAAFEKATGKPAIQQLMELADNSDRADAQQMTAYERDMDRNVREATKYGTEQTKVVNDAAALALKNANSASTARLNAMGMGGSTLLTDAMGSNAAAVERGRAANVADIAGKATGLKIQTVGQRAGGRAALHNQFADRRNALRSGLANVKLGLAGQQAGMWAGQSLPPVGGASGAGTALTSLGNTAGTLGGILLAKDLYGKE